MRRETPHDRFPLRCRPRRGSRAAVTVVFWTLLLLWSNFPLHGDASETPGGTGNGWALEKAKGVAKEMLAAKRAISRSAAAEPLAASLGRIEETLGELQRKAAAAEEYAAQVERLRNERTTLAQSRQAVIAAYDAFGTKLRSSRFASRESRLDDSRKHLEQNVSALDEQLGTILRNSSNRTAIGEATRSAMTHLRQPTSERLNVREHQPPIVPATSPIEPLQPRLAPVTRAGGSTLERLLSPANALEAQPFVARSEDLEAPPDCRTGKGAFPPEVTQLAATLNHSPLEIYQHVRNQYRFEIYGGARKGCVATLQTGAGNDYDLATLLVSLMRSSCVPARYIGGQVDLSVTEVNDWLGVKDARIANALLNFGGIDTTSFTDGSGAILFHRINRVWVTVLSRKAVMLDPAFKLQKFQTGIDDIPSQVLFNENDCAASPPGYLCQAHRELAYEYYREQVRQHLQANLPGTSLADIPYQGQIIPDESNRLPETLPYARIQITDEFSQLPASLHHRAVLTVRGEQNSLIQTALDLPVASGGGDSAALVARKTMSFVPATPDDQDLLDLYGGLENTPCGLVDLIPRLKLEGLVVGTGTAVPSCTLMTWSIDFLPAGEAPPSCGNGALDAGEQCDDGNLANGDSCSAACTVPVQHFFVAGEHAALGLDGGQISQSLLNDRALRLLDANAGRCSPCEASCTEECAAPADEDSLTGELLNLAANLYFKRLGEGEGTIRDLFHYHPVLTIGEGLTRSGFGVLYLFDRPFAVTPRGPLLDVRGAPTVSVHIAGKQGDGISFRRLVGINSSAQEHALWEELLAVESISTIKILQVANSTGVTVRLRDVGDDPIECQDGVVRPFFGCGAAPGCLETCGVNPGLIGLICDDLADGRLITAPECPTTLNQWNGFGWITETPAHDAWGYLISGGISAEEIIGSATTETPKLSDTPGVLPADAVTAQSRLAGLPSHTIDQTNIESLLPHLTLPEPLRRHIQQLVTTGAVITLSEAVLSEGGREVLLFGVRDSLTGRISYFYYDLAIGGGAGSENPPKGIPGSRSNTGDGQGVTTAGDPVNVANGNFVRTEVDFALPALPNALAFTRTYNSLSTDDIGLGAGWTHDYSERLAEATDGTVTWTNTRGGRFTFTPDGNGGFITPANLSDTGEVLQRTAEGWLLRSKHGMTREFASAGQLVVRRDRNGNAESLSYDAAGRLARVTDAAGRALTVGSHADGHIATVTDFTGRTWRYAFDGAHLARVEGPSDGTTQPIITRYAYFDGPLNRDRLQRVTEPNGGVLALAYYTNHRVFQVTDPAGGIATFSYQLLQNQTDYIDPRGFRTRYRYNDLGNVEAIEYPDGEIERWTWVNHQVTSHTDPLGHVETFRYDAHGNLIGATDATGIEATFDYEPVFAKPTRLALPGGRETRLSYDTRGNPTEIRDAEGGVRLLEWDDHGLPVRITDAKGNAFTRQYNPAGQLIAQQTLLPSQETVDYTPRGRAQVHTDANLHPTSFAYDLLDRLIQTTDAEGGVARRAYDRSGRLVASTDARGATTRFEYDSLDRLTRVVHPDKTATAFDYDPAGNLVAVTDALGRVTRHTYDSRGRRVQTDYPDGSHVAYRLDAADRLVGITDALGQTTGYAYDAAGRLVSTTDPLGHTTLADYDEVGNLAAVTDRRGAVSRLVYDRLNRLTQVSRDGGYLATLDYDANGNLVSRARYDIAGLGNVPDDPRLLPSERRQQNTWTYDVLNRVLSFVDAENAETAYRYDPVGNLIGSTDPLGQATTWEHDRLNRVTTIVYADGGRLKAAYDPVGNRTSVTTPQGGTYRWAYDTLNRVITATDPLRKRTGISYDAVGNLVRRSHPDGSWVAQQYDAMNRPQRLTRSDKTSIDYGYDAVGNLVRTATPDVESVFGYDPLYRVLNETTRFLGDGYEATVAYTYDAEGNLATVTDPLQRMIRYDYDLLPVLTGVSIEGQGSVARIARDGFQRRSEVELGNGIHESYRYDRNDRMTAIDAGADIAQLTYTRDSVGDPIAIAERLGGVSEELSLAYDAMHRPTQVSASVDPVGRGESISYDLNGNLVRLERQQASPVNATMRHGTPAVNPAGVLLAANDDQAVSVQFNRADQPLNAGDTRYRYDTAGNRLDTRMAGNRRLAVRHNASQQLTSLQEFGRNRLQRKADLIYDGLGRLVELRDNGTTRRIIHAFENRLLELDANGAPLIAYTMGPTTDDAFSVAVAGQTRYLHRDLINSVRAMTDAAGQIVATHSYSLFGQVQTTSGEPSPIGFAGRPQDPRTGLMEFRARWYDPQRGQFIERDPLAASGIYQDDSGVQFNLYGYANSRPLAFVDPMGLKPKNPFYSFLRSPEMKFLKGEAEEFGRQLWDLGKEGINFLADSLVGTKIQIAGSETEKIWWNSGAGLESNTMRSLARGTLPQEVLQSFTSLPARWDSTVRQSLYYSDAGDYEEAGREFSKVLFEAASLAALVEGGASVARSVTTRTAAAGGASEASSLANAARLRAQLAGQEIAGGHAFEKHILQNGEFQGLEIRTRDQFASHIENVINNPAATRQLSGGRTAYWDDATSTVVIRNPRAADGGTAFQPVNGRAYFDSLR